MQSVDLIVANIGQLVTCASKGTAKRSIQMQDVHLIENGALAISNGKFVAVGANIDVLSMFSSPNIIDAKGQVVCPGFVDAHTHLVFAGDRIDEFELRLKGASYLEIMQAGGGIASTSRATRAASLSQLVDEAKTRLELLLSLGTTTVEIKSGYGLDVPTELKILDAAAVLAEETALDIVPTFLGAHAIPSEYKAHPQAYVSLVIDEMLPLVHEWKKAHPQQRYLYNDVFCEQGAFTLEQSERILKAGLAYDLPVKIHADEFTNLHAVPLAVKYGAVSVDHLDVTPDEEIEVLAQSNTVGVVLPAVNFNFGSAHYAPARKMIDAGVALALATDINPGSAPCYSMPLVMAIACRYQHITPAEALNASTINAAHALGLGDTIGSIEVGKQADFLILELYDYRYLMYAYGVNFVSKVFKKGEVVFSKGC